MNLLSKFNMSHMPLYEYANLEKILSKDMQNRLCHTHSEVLKDLIDEAIYRSSDETDIESNINTLLADQNYMINLHRQHGVL